MKVKNTLVFLVALILSGVAALSCSDGKLNLLLVFRTDREEDDPVMFPPHISSSAAAKVSSSSAEVSSSSEEPPPSSSSEEPPPPSSSEEPSSSSSEPSSSSVPSSSSSEPSSSSRGPRSSSSKTKDGYTYEDYPTLDDKNAERAQPGGITRYWDGCKPSCSYAQNVFLKDMTTRSPHGFARNCDRNGKEMPLFYRMDPVQPTWAEFIYTPNACNPSNTHEWTQSTTYREWTAAHPDFPSGVAHSAAYICSADQIPYAVNDTLAYAFVANNAGNCGKCFQVQFRGDWEYGAARPSHKAISGKTLIVMVNNFGVGDDAFDIMIPGGGLGAYDALSEQLGKNPDDLGYRMGGLLSECIFEGRDSRNPPDYSNPKVGLNPHERATLEESKDCLRAKCNRAFNNNPTLLKGCLWHVDWFEAVDNPEGFMKEVECPKYLIDRYGSTIPTPTRPADLNPGVACNIGNISCPAP